MKKNNSNPAVFTVNKSLMKKSAQNRKAKKADLIAEVEKLEAASREVGMTVPESPDYKLLNNDDIVDIYAALAGEYTAFINGSNDPAPVAEPESDPAPQAEEAPAETPAPKATKKAPKKTKPETVGVFAITGEYDELMADEEFVKAMEAVKGEFGVEFVRAAENKFGTFAIKGLPAQVQGALKKLFDDEEDFDLIPVKEASKGGSKGAKKAPKTDAPTEKAEEKSDEAKAETKAKKEKPAKESKSLTGRLDEANGRITRYTAELTEKESALADEKTPEAERAALKKRIASLKRKIKRAGVTADKYGTQPATEEAQGE